MEVVATEVTFGTIVELAVQLGSGVLKTQKLVRSIKSAPREIEDLQKELQLFSALLAETASVAKRQDESELSPASPRMLYLALQNCKAKLAYLDQRFAEHDVACQRSRSFKVWARVTAPLTKGNIEKARLRIQEAMSTLSNSIAINHLNIRQVSAEVYRATFSI